MTNERNAASSACLGGGEATVGSMQKKCETAPAIPGAPWTYEATNDGNAVSSACLGGAQLLLGAGRVERDGTSNARFRWKGTLPKHLNSWRREPRGRRESATRPMKKIPHRGRVGVCLGRRRVAVLGVLGSGSQSSDGANERAEKGSGLLRVKLTANYGIST
jgi:hypothetical protein